MPCKKKDKSSQKPSAGTSFDIGLDGTFPVEALEILLSVPSWSHGDDAMEPTPKRRKIEKDLSSRQESSSISIAKGQLSISRRCNAYASAKISKSTTGVDSCFDLGIRLGRLTIKSRPSCPTRAFHATISLKPSDACENARRILEVKTCPRKTLDGTIWSTVDMVVERRCKTVSLRFSLELFWNVTPWPYLPLRNSINRKVSKKLIDNFFPTDQGDGAPSCKAFYEAAFVPPKGDGSCQSIQVPHLTATLFPYQERTLRWLLSREGVKWSEANSHVDRLTSRESDCQVDAFRVVQDTQGRDVFLSDVMHLVTRDKAPYRQADLNVKGGILAEEMGLGKTLEMLALILSHRFTTPSESVPPSLTPSRATLIVTPKCLNQQWMSEISRHAPTLRVLNYQGCKRNGSMDYNSNRRDETDDQAGDTGQGENQEAVLQQMAACDIVLTTYSVLSAELYFALEPRERSRRYERVYPRKTSPLVKILWWRLCLDEAQMIENGLSLAATVVQAIPRVNSWAMTGTPVKNSVKDLFGLFVLLDYRPWCNERQVWQALLQHHKGLFQQLIGWISLRHTKAQVRDEIQLPTQKRYIMTVPFNAVEEQHYQSLFEQMASECKLGLDGVPLVRDWNIKDYEEIMRHWLDRLRQTALHPEVGIYSRRVLGSDGNKPIRTVEEVLNAMVDQCELALRTHERGLMSLYLLQGQLYENMGQVKAAIYNWNRVRKDTDRELNLCRAKLEVAMSLSGVKGAKADLTPVSDSHDDEDDSERRRKVAEIKRQLRSTLEMHHKAVFFCANGYYQLRENMGRTKGKVGEIDQEWAEPGSEYYQRLKKLESDSYEEAKETRREILGSSRDKVLGLMDAIERKSREQSFAEIPELVVGGEQETESAEVMERLAGLYQELNVQAHMIKVWRGQVVELLLQRLVDEEEDSEATGEELGDSAKFQDLLMVYHQVLRSAISDRQDAISGQVNQLVKHETDMALKMAEQGEGPAPDKMVEALRKRDQAKARLKGISMRGAIGELRALQTRREATQGQGVAATALRATQTQLSGQSRAILELEAELDSFKMTMNARLEYYRQLQAVSDAVLAVDEEAPEEALAEAKRNEASLVDKLGTLRAKFRYLLNVREAGSKSWTCIICQATFATGVMTVCGHQYCKECMTLWFQTHHSCPLCKTALQRGDMHDVTLQPRQLDRDGEQQHQAPKAKPRPRHSRGSIYTDVDADKLREISKIDLGGSSLTTKVEALVRHLLWLRDADPGAKAIVFSQYASFLRLLREALDRFHIGCASVDDAGGIERFRSDAAVDAFLLHARAHSSGLNLVQASHVLLCEPLLNTRLELQAVARVDRIGQRFETTVWLFLVAGSVEESVHHLSARRRLEHAAAGAAKQQEAPPSLMSRNKEAGEMVLGHDLWECLFGHVARARAADEAHKTATMIAQDETCKPEMWQRRKS
ncbi:hypothetical protein CDD82_1716 [Ophiocordyceps australis]|uniref:RING-type domain-containing protein n=1 Tax=Ophiocordyceps australis TaxID=1399860 RepID=A0A2C5ZKC8_9HYPO|nr:hypothetical protein CDD82_1716 [Ophiocordyceps australis]